MNEADPGRRGFFRAFAAQVIDAAASVSRAAGELQRTSSDAARELLDPAAAVIGGSPPPSGAASRAVSAGSPSGFRTPFRWESDEVLLVVDQRKLPGELVELPVRNAHEAATVIREMAVRGAPAIGQVAAIGLALAAHGARDSQSYARRAILAAARNMLRGSRPTAVNLAWAVDRVMARLDEFDDPPTDGHAVAAAFRAEADRIVFETTTDHGRLAEYGAAALPATGDTPLRILTHCNTGPLACGQYGTALGIVQAAHHAERPLQVWVDETRPWLQGARLTAWELDQAGVPHSVIVDGAAGHLMARGEVDVVLVGADRVAANGDTANKIGTYTLAVLAARHGIPFYVCAPLSSVDVETPDGAAIPIEERAATEVTAIRGIRIAPVGTAVRNPAFDVTPAELITGIVTDEGVLAPPYEPAIRAAIERRTARWAATEVPF
jgi:methylthioribose-1-phosphate isomerase